MKLHVFLVVAVLLSMAACAEKEQAAPDPADATTMAAPEADAPMPETLGGRDDAFLGHMHLHAKRLDDLNFALADNDLEAAKLPARWLSRHDSVDDVDSEWMPFLYGMRSNAEAVENATDLETARAAAERITAQCQSCHAAAGVVTE